MRVGIEVEYGGRVRRVAMLAMQFRGACRRGCDVLRRVSWAEARMRGVGGMGLSTPQEKIDGGGE